jgi:glycosyltransferase involved in cell wall biosynthesis
LLLVENNAYPFDVRVRREALALHAAGYRVSVIAPRAPGQRWSETVDGVAIWRFPAPPGGHGVLSYAFEFVTATVMILLLSLWVALRRGVDVVHTANPPDTLFVVGALFKLLGRRFVFDHHDLAPETYLSRFAQPQPDSVYYTLRQMERCTFALADIVISTNESYRQVALGRGGKAPGQVFVVRNGPPLAYRPLTPDATLARRARHLIGYIGTMGPQDGVDHWLRALRELVRTLGHSDVLAVIIGSGDSARSLQALAWELGIAPQIWFTGRIGDRDARTLLSSVAVCVQPDPSGPLNDCSTMNKAMEYMALSKPLVAFDLPETRVSVGDAGLYARPNDVLDFARQVSWLLDHPAEGAAMGRRGRQRVESSLAWEHSVDQLLCAYGDGLGLRPERPGVSTPVPDHPGLG